MFKFSKRLSFSKLFIKIWLGCVALFLAGLVYSMRNPFNPKSGEPTPLRAYLLLGVVIIGVLSFILSMIFSIKEGSRFSKILKVVLKLGVFVVCLGPALYVLAFLIEPDLTQWIIYPIFLFCVILTIVFKVLIKKILFPKKKPPSQP